MKTDEMLLSSYSAGRSLVVDLGTCNGKSAAIMAQNAERVITVDLFEDFEKIVNEGSRAHYKKVFESSPHYYEHVKLALSCYSNITVVKDFTYEYAKAQNDTSVDLVFIDADHSFLGTSKDFNAWFPKVKQGGIFIFHDANCESWDVGMFCEHLISSNSKVELIVTSEVAKVFKKI